MLLRVELFPGEKELVRILLLLLVVIRFILLGTVYILSGVKHQISFPNISVNAAISEDPSRAVAAFILPISAMITLVVVTLRLRRSSFIVHSVFQWVVWCMIFAGTLLAFVGLLGIAAVTLETDSALAYTFSGLWLAGSVVQVIGITVFNISVSLIVPLWLSLLRIVLTAIVALSTVGLALTVGWVPQADWIIEIILSCFVVLFMWTLAHTSEFPLRSSCPFASPASVPPLPALRGPHRSLLLLKEVE